MYATYNQHPIPPQNNLHTIQLDVTQSLPESSWLPDTLDGVVYCPGAIRLRSFLQVTTKELQSDFQLQVMGAFRVLQRAVPLLRKNGSGSIVLFSSIAAGRGFPFHSIVATSKGAIEALTRTLAAELAPVVRVNCIAPSITDTPLAGRLMDTEEKKQQHSARHPLKKTGRPGDIAAAACFLLSPKSGWTTGQVLHIDGGLSTLS